VAIAISKISIKFIMLVTKLLKLKIEIYTNNYKDGWKYFKIGQLKT
jgi:hypothetical protein